MTCSPAAARRSSSACRAESTGACPPRTKPKLVLGMTDPPGRARRREPGRGAILGRDFFVTIAGRRAEIQGMKAFTVATLAIALAALLYPAPARALDPSRAVTQYTVQTWYAKDGLPQNSVNAAYQSADGYLWFATEEGLARFDGAQFVTYNHKSGALRHNYVVSLWPA